jgi:hypothetical protein
VNRRLLVTLWALTVIAAAVWVYGPTLFDPFPLGDEGALTTYLRDHHDAQELRRELTGRLIPAVPYWRPVAMPTLLLDYVISGRPGPGESPFAPGVSFVYRLDNLAWHVIASFAFALLLWRLGGPVLGMAGGLLYAVDANNFRTATFPSLRFGAMCVPFMFLSLWAFFGLARPAHQPRRWIVLSLVFLALALGAKQHALALPLVAAGAALLFFPRDRWRVAFATILAMLGIGGLYLLGHRLAIGFIVSDELKGPLPAFWSAMSHFLFGWVWGLWNWLQSAGTPLVLLVPGQGGIFLRALLPVVGVALVAWKRWKLLAFAALWGVLMYAPIAHVHAFNLWRHYLETPGVAGIMVKAGVAAWLIQGLAFRVRAWRTRPPHPVAAS